MATTRKTPRAPVAREYDNRFKVSGTTYPADLMDPTGPYGGNYVMFRINVHQDSYLSKEGGKEDYIPPGTLPSSRRSDVASGISGASTATALGVASGIAGGQIAKQGAGAVGIDLSSKGTAVAGGMVGIAVGVTALGQAKAEYKTQTKAICLYMPNDLSIKYGVTWDETSLAGTAALIAGAENLGAAALKVGAAAGVGALAAKGLGLGKTGTKIATGLGAAVGGVAAANNAAALRDVGMAQALKIPGAGELASKSSGLAANPKKEQIFKQVEFRTFTFSYQFFPRSPEEAKSVRDIIKEFKLHMHPEYKDPGQFLYIFPSEFDIIYYTNGSENLNLHRHTSCVLTDMNVSYSPQGVFTAFADGMPSQINIQLTFRELSLLTKQDIDNGF